MAVPGPLSNKCSLCRGLWHLQSDVTHSQPTGSVSPAPAWLSLASSRSRIGWHEMNMGHRSWDGEGNQDLVALMQCLGCLSEGCRWGHAAAHTLPCPTGTGSVPRKMPGAGRDHQGQAALQGCTPCSSVPRAWHRACPPWEGTGDMEEHGQRCRQHCQEHFLPPRRKVCAGSGNTESFPERGVMSWQQRESPA